VVVRPAISVAVAIVLLVGLVVLAGYSLSSYPGCEKGQPCPTGERVIIEVNGVFLTAAITLFVVAIVRFVGSLWRSRRHKRVADD
jgi:hypothetical protein